MPEIQEDLTAFCAPGCKYEFRHVPVAPGVTLRVITFTPPVHTTNPAIVFVPGWISLMDGWQSVLQTMSRDFIIHYVETREKISSLITGKVGYAVADFAGDIVGLINKLNLPPRAYVLFGSSLGATTLLECFPALAIEPLALVLIGPNAVFSIPGFWLHVVRAFPPRLYLAFKPVIKWYLRHFRLDVAQDAAQYQKYCRNLDAADPWKLKKAALTFARYQVWDKLPLVTCPTLLVGATHDVLHDFDNINRIRESLPNCTFLDLETNSRTHSPAVVEEMRRYLAALE